MPRASDTGADRMGGGVGRRAFLGAVAGTAVAPGLARGQGSPRAAPRRARNLILLCVDGMSTGALSISDHIRRRKLGLGSRWFEWMNEPGVRSALVETAPALGVLTDSAAAASAWGIGRRVNNGAINVTPEGDEPTPLFVRGQNAGKRIGLVTTSYLTDASPAAMMCSAKSRARRARIANQMIERGVDLGIGGGAGDFTEEMVRGSGVRVARSWEALAGAIAADPERRTFGLLESGPLPYALDRAPGGPSMRDLADLSLRVMAGARDGFCLFIENENIDESAHANDAAALAHDMLEVEETLDLLTAFTASRDDTLLIATTDHACANPGFSSAGAEGEEQLGRLASASRSFDWIGARFGALDAPRRSAEALAGLINNATGATLDEYEIEALRRKLARDRVIPYRRADSVSSVMGSILANHLGVAFTGRMHATDRVIATAMGPGAEALPAACHQTRLHDLMADALCISA